MKLILINLNINNFKGIKSLNIDFDAHQTSIFAANEIGKTTISDAWHWLLTGKNSNDQKDFNIKNTANLELNRADHEVSATIMAGNSEVTLKKIYREKWIKKRGEQVSEFSGHETLYYCNDVPMQQSEYQAKINGLLPESVLKMIANPLFFNSNTNQWGWQKRREVLLAIGGHISDTDVFNAITTADNRNAVQNLQFIISNGKSFLEYKTQIASNKKRLKEELKAIPTRIDEITRSLPEVLDYDAIQLQINSKTGEIKKLDEAIANKNKALQAQHEAIQERQGKIHELTSRRNEISFQIKSAINNAQRDVNNEKSILVNEVNRLTREIQFIQRSISDTVSKKTSAQNQIAALRQNWSKFNAREIEFNEHEFSCPTCKRAYETDNIEEMKATMVKNFNADKERELDKINNTGVELVQTIAGYDELIKTSETDVTKLGDELKEANEKLTKFEQPVAAISLEEALANNDEYVQLGADIVSLQAKNNELKPADNSEITTQKNLINLEIDALKKQLNTKETIDRSNLRIKELYNEENKLAQELADLEKTEFLIEDFNRSKMDILETRINGKFKFVKFKLFDRQINGGEAETCETIYKDVPFSDLNTAGKIWAGIDIINTLSSHYQVSAPIFLDNRESVSRIPHTDSQVINLVVSAEDKVIRVVAGDHELMNVA